MHIEAVHCDLSDWMRINWPNDSGLRLLRADIIDSCDQCPPCLLTPGAAGLMTNPHPVTLVTHSSPSPSTLPWLMWRRPLPPLGWGNTDDNALNWNRNCYAGLWRIWDLTQIQMPLYAVLSCPLWSGGLILISNLCWFSKMFRLHHRYVTKTPFFFLSCNNWFLISLLKQKPNILTFA